MSLRIDVEQGLGAFRLAVRFESAGPLTVLFGPSGSGKTSLVDLVAGLSRPRRGRIEIDGAVLLDTERGIEVARHRRRIGYVFQDARLFPHLTVRRNLTYGRWFTPSAERKASFEGVVDLLGLERLLDRAPQRLSGGERQRVAIGRALLASPRLLLMDEPLAALDEARKADILPFIQRLRDEAGIPILYVSHSVPEVLRLGSDLVALDAGRVVATGRPAEVLARLDLLPAGPGLEEGRPLDTVVAGHDERDALTTLASAAGEILVPRIEAAIGTPVRIHIRARDVMLALERPRDLSALNILPAVIRALRPHPVSGMDIRLDCGGAELLARLTRRSAEALHLREGLAVHAVVKAVALDRPAGGTGRLDP
ncbi:MULTISPECIES: molybdenum ABC transporter ATP-binding protein [unclassified Aureimonas]|uniref:molybdenum ABC transporter ATP-binding protein n=1 Tax=unclassified Aureimonas TaxID=2615206 RepID=UPI0006FF360C|nr:MULTISPECIES: molybdenum ABC transporter ATP-binding protein [unclassified Aureimonas]KQT66155.1 molybdenum ABC transporter ATP-binding protein [Aureimonas sp. Leaf427]KQT73400.1 molybdenum ABC transporter ATP-binding protein [Aureimonas sp. Leaf460]